MISNSLSRRAQDKLGWEKCIDPTCYNRGVALDGAVASNFIKTVVGPCLQKDIGIHWINF